MAESTSATLSHATTGTLKRFRYHGIDIATGRQQTGELAAETAYAVRSSLRRIGFNTLSVQPLATEQSPTWLKPLIDAWHQRQRLRRRPLKADFCDAVATMLQAGIVLDEALHALAVSPTRSVVERGLAARMRDGLRAGQPLSTVCANETAWFDRFDVALISAGEQAGDLNETLLAIVNHHLRAGNLNQRLFIALVYPTLLALAGLGVLEFMSHQVLPQLISLIAQSHHQPPALTIHVMELGQWLGRWWPLALVGLAASAVLIKRIIAAIPPTHIIVRILRENAWTRVTRRYRAARLAWSLSRLCRSGMPLMEAVSVAADTTDEPLLRASLAEAAQAIARGEDFSTSIAQNRLLDPEFAQLLSLGERSGELVSVLERIAERSHRSADRATDRLMAILNPLAVLFLAVLIGILVLAAALPLAQLGDLV